MAADAGVSLGVVLAGIAILLTGWLWIDPVVSLIIVAVILVSTWGLLRDLVNLVLDAVPEDVDVVKVQAYLASLPGVNDVHDLHIWGIGTTETALTAHLVMQNAAGDDALLSRACRELHDQFGIEHATLQFETGDASYPCHLAPADTVGMHGGNQRVVTQRTQPIFVIGDVHGQFERLLGLLLSVGLVGPTMTWIGADAICGSLVIYSTAGRIVSMSSIW